MCRRWSSEAIPEKQVREGQCEQCAFPNHVKIPAFKLDNSNQFGCVVGGLR